MKASSFSFDNSISAKNGTRRSTSTSCSKLTFGLPMSWRFALSLSFRRHQQRGQRTLMVEVGEAPLLLELAGAQHHYPIEIAREAGAVQHPDQAPAAQLAKD